MAIHTIGDSHSYSGWPQGTNINHLGPVLCYSFGRENLKKCDISNINLKDDDYVIFCFGEIDCRCHVHKYVDEHNSYESVIDSIVENYIDAININLSTIQAKIKVCVYNVVPPIQKYNTEENPEYPFLGTDEERKSYVLYFNKRLKSKCEEIGFIFFDIYDFYTDESGFLRKDMSDGSVHIVNGIHLTDFITKELV
jgi:hypothetical protein